MACKRELTSVWGNRKRVAFVDGGRDISYTVFACRTPGCSLEGAAIKPELLTTRVLPRREFGLDVIRLIGYYRVRLSLSIPKIRTALIDVHEVLISEREVEDLLNIYVALSTTDVRNDPKLVARLRKQGRLVLTVDGAKPDADGEALWLIRDHISSEVLFGFTARAVDAKTLAAKIGVVVDLGIPIVGAVSDGEPVVVDAIKKALPKTPHQLCQYHFLDNFAKGVKKLDGTLGRTLAQDLKGLNRFEDAAGRSLSKRAVESNIPGPTSLTIPVDVGAPKKSRGRRRRYERLCHPRDEEEARFARDVCEVARAAIGGSGKPPLETPGFDRVERIAEFHDALAECARKTGGFQSSCAATSPGR